ncbi:MAG: methyltransferase domain-containing protein [Alphaproteobacteria bacterium]|nr:methyltransferase domain-containing protein [Alphaproteobacteria bacterium]
MRDEARFLKAWVEDPVKTGAVSPSGRFLSRAMARHVDLSIEGPVVELGPGTGPVTQALLDHGIAPERLVLVEFDEKFCGLLRQRFPRARVVQGDAYNLAATLSGVLDGPAAAIVSSLPLLNRPEDDRVRLLRDSFAMLHPQGNFVQFTYGMISPIPRTKNNSGSPHFEAQGSAPVWLNLPPARVFAYRPASQSQAKKNQNPVAVFLNRIKAGAGKMRDELIERRDRIETELRLARDKVRIDIENRTTQLRNAPQTRQTLELLKKLGEPRRPPRDRF